MESCHEVKVDLAWIRTKKPKKKPFCLCEHAKYAQTISASADIDSDTNHTYYTTPTMYWRLMYFYMLVWFCTIITKMTLKT